MHQIKFYVYESCVKYFILAIWSQGNLGENRSSVPFACCTGQHNWGCCLNESEKTEVLCHTRCGTIKIPP